MNDTSTILNDFFDSFSPSLSGNLRENRLERMNFLLKEIGNPERNIKMIHIAGSKGKGTTASFMSWVMNKKGLKTGLYLSPHVYDIRERFTLGTSFFSESLYLSTLKKLKERIKDFSLPKELGPEKPTTFELYTAYAYLLFKSAGCEYAVIETGLGGRLDATNTIDPIANCFTYIEKEHTKILGSTLEEIAKEKAGIMRKDVPSFIMNMPLEALNTLKKESETIGSKVEDFPLSFEDIPYKNDILTLYGDNTPIKIYSPSGLTDVELYDFSFALYVLSKTRVCKFEGNESLDLSQCFSLPGRFQSQRVLIDNKTINFIFDGAHTISSIEHLMRNIDNYGFSPLSTLIFSTAIDKNYKEMADILVPSFDNIIITGLGESKKSDPKAIYEYISNKWKDKSVTLSPTASDAAEKTLKTTLNDDNVIVTGSFYLVDLIHNALDNLES